MGGTGAWTPGNVRLRQEQWTRTEAEAGWFGEVWPARDADGWRYAFHCRHALPDPTIRAARRSFTATGPAGPLCSWVPAAGEFSDDQVLPLLTDD